MPRAIAILSGTILDGTGAAPVIAGALVIEDGRITAIGKGGDVAVPDGAEIINASGKTVLPGIIEGHAHVGGRPADQKTLRLTLQRGITTVCSVSANLTGIALRDGIESGDVRGCARMIAGCIVSPTNGHVRFRDADGPWEVRRAVREMVEAGADFIKTAASGGFYGRNEQCNSPNYTFEELDALVSEAHAWGLPVVCHVHTQPGLDSCIRAGVDQLHHGAFIDEKAMRGIRGADLCYMPTLAVTCRRNIEALDATQPWQTKEMKEAHDIHRAGVRLAHEIGVKLCVGTDYPGTPLTWRIGDRTHYELQQLVACGLTPLEALVAATRVNAAAYGLGEELGTLEPGKEADVLIVTGDPTADVAVLYEPANINVVLKDGEVEYADEAHKAHYRIAEDQPADRARL